MEARWVSTGAQQSLSAIALGLMASMQFQPAIVEESPRDKNLLQYAAGNFTVIQSGEGSTASNLPSLVVVEPGAYFDFPGALSAVFDKFLSGQRPLEGDAAKILADNLWDLYAT